MLVAAPATQGPQLFSEAHRLPSGTRQRKRVAMQPQVIQSWHPLGAALSCPILYLFYLEVLGRHYLTLGCFSSTYSPVHQLGCY